MLSFSLHLSAQDNKPFLDKVHHAEPLYNDLVRDLGARKGEREFNVGVDLKRMHNTDEYGYLVEYEFAPIDRLGLEIETDFSYSRSQVMPFSSNNRLERLRLSSQYSFYVSKPKACTLAVGYTQIFDFVKGGTAFNPFFVAAKNWHNSWHALIYTGPEIGYYNSISDWDASWQLNTSFFYTLPNTDHFIGMEVNQQISSGQVETILRPQIKLGLSSQLAVGMAVGVPISGDEHNLSSFFRLIYQL